ncbi:hypothetical protein FEM08_27770 [Flavobacterium gilvum]|nr:hypothetical protein FEM08_27770 [Flavobacterium gilvum]
MIIDIANKINYICRIFGTPIQYNKWGRLVLTASRIEK